MEEIEEEIEAIGAIYMKEMKVVERGEGSVTLCIRVEGEDKWVDLEVTLRMGYPDDAGAIDVEMGDAHMVARSELNELRTLLRDEADALVGTPMVYELVNYASDWLLTHGGIEAEHEEEEAGDEAAEAKEKVVLGEGGLSRRELGDGQPITREAFLAWRDKYDRELEEKRRLIPNPKGPTGRQLFEIDESLFDGEV